MFCKDNGSTSGVRMGNSFEWSRNLDGEYWTASIQQWHSTHALCWAEAITGRLLVSYFMYALLITFRVLVQLFNSILSRQATFLAHDVWTTTPFHGQATPMMQQLLNKASKLPSLLQRFDIIKSSAEQVDFVAIGKLWQDFQIFAIELQNWESSQWNHAPSSLFWVKLTQNSSAPPDLQDLWFPNLMVANSLTHCWAFRIIAISHLDEFRDTIAALHGHNPQQALDIDFKSVTEMPVATLAARICDSMAYLFQSEMKLYGPSSTFFTLSTAIRVFKRNPDRYSTQILRCQKIVARLDALGLQSPVV